MGEFAAVALGAPLVVVAVLPAPGGIDADRLDVAAFVGADPHLGPGGWHRERPDPFQGVRVGHGLALE
ncbi:hypothetical protein ACFQY4_17430 [Catellatospora bangladeshensis]|uniref:hypothetical protein n=1 Tax=Catellatospora bangladeshensis TaxID=310355 RepID=UPI003609878E